MLTTIRARLYGLVGLMVLFMIALGIIGLNTSAHSVATLDRVYKDRVVPLSDLKEVVDAYAVNIVDTTHKVRDGQLTFEQGLKNVSDAQALIDTKWKKFLATDLVEEELRIVKATQLLMDAGDIATGRLKELLSNRDTEGITQFSRESLYPVMDPLSDEFAKLIKVQLDVAHSEYEEESSRYAEARIALILIIVLGSALAIAIAVWTIKTRVSRPLSSAQQLAEAIAAGCLTNTIDTRRKDEVGLLLNAMSTMQSRLRDVVSTIQSNATALNEASTTLTTSTDSVLSASEQQSDAASSMASAVEELTVSVQQISQNADEARTQSIQAGELSDRGGATIQSVVEDNANIVNAANDSARSVEQLGELSTEIRGIVSVIREVADQTNLLALNAAIEAARAGEQGRGFAVVADEVRKLAERTSKSTEEITSIVERISSGTANAVERMQTQVKLVTKCAEMSKVAGDSVNEIRGGSRKVVDVINDISSALRDQSAASNDIARNVEQIAQMSEHNHATVQKTAESARNLKHMAEELKGAVASFSI